MARELGMTVSSMLSSMSQAELNYWMAYFRIENEETSKDSTEPKLDENGFKVVSEEEQEVRDQSLIAQLMKFAEPA